jgi:DNA polymerase III alpha subunit
MAFSADIDIDFPTSFKPEDVFPWTRASQVKNGYLTPHVCGVYPQRVPIDHVTNVSAIPYKEAEELGYTKIDMLHVSIYDHFKSRDEIQALLEIEPDWGLLLIPSEQKKLFQLSNHGDVLNKVKPKNIEQLADVLALIRPGKKQLANLYSVDTAATRRILYAKDESGYSFKKSHAIAYAMVIVLQLHLISAGIL